MCFGGGDNAKGEAKREQQRSRKIQQQTKADERERQQDIRLGKRQIDQAFRRFNPAYYRGFQKDYKGYYFPQIKDQYDQGSSKLFAALAERGIDESTVGANAQADLFGDYQDERARIANEAKDASNQLRGQVEDAKTDLYVLNQASADPKGINARARGQATALVAPQSYSPIGQVFAAGLEPWLSYAKNRASQPGPSYQSPYGNVPKTGSGTVVG